MRAWFSRASDYNQKNVVVALSTAPDIKLFASIHSASILVEGTQWIVRSNTNAKYFGEVAWRTDVFGQALLKTWSCMKRGSSGTTKD